MRSGRRGLLGVAGTTCAVCAIHRLLAEGKGLLEGLSLACQTQGYVPAGLGGTIPLARQTFYLADQATASFIPASGTEAAQVLQVRLKINKLTRYMNGIRLMNCAQVMQASQMANEAWWSGYQLAWMVYGR